MDDRLDFENFPWLAYVKHKDEIGPEEQEEALNLAEELKLFWETSAILSPEQVEQERGEAVAMHNRLNELGFLVTTSTEIKIDEESGGFKVSATVTLFTAKHKTGDKKPN